MVLKPLSRTVVVFALDEVRFALSMNVVERVVRAVEVSPVPDAPPGVIGVINLHGRIIPVFDIRPRFNLAPREIRVSDHLLIAHAGDRDVAVLVDAAVDVVAADDTSVTLAADTLASLGAVEGVVVQGGAIVPIQDLSRFLPSETRKTTATELKLVA